MHILFTVVGALALALGLFVVYIHTYTEIFGLALIGAACFFAIVGRMAQASYQHGEILRKWNGE